MSEKEQFKNNSKFQIEKYILNFYYGTDDKPISIVDSISGSSMVEICSKFPLLVAQITKKIADQKLSTEIEKWINKDDDIPF